MIGPPRCNGRIGRERFFGFMVHNKFVGERQIYIFFRFAILKKHQKIEVY